MPQLNPSPWFTIMTMSWIVLLVFLGPKIMSTTSQNQPATHEQVLYKTAPWNWPWT